MENRNINTLELLTAISEGDRYAFNQLYNLYYEKVSRQCYFIVKNKEIARDIVAEVFFCVWQSRKKLVAVKNLDAYIYIISRHESLRYLKETEDFRKVSLEEIPIRIEKEGIVSPEEQLLNEEIEKLFTRAVNELPERCRMIFLLSRHEKLKSREIAELLSINESTVRVQMKIAVEKIIEKLRPHFPDLTLSFILFMLK